MEVAGLCVRHQFVEVHAGLLRQLAGDFKLDPTGGLELRLVAFQERFFTGVGVAHHLPGIAGHLGFVNEDHADGAFAGGFFVFVGPAAVVSEGAAFEEIRVVGGRLTDQHEQDFAANVGAFVVVPFVFGGLNSVSDENDGGVYVAGGALGFVVSDVFVERLEFEGVTFIGDEFESGFGRGSDPDHRHFLEVGPVVAGGLQSIEPELGGDVFGGKVASALASAAAFEKVERERADVGANMFGVNFFEGGNGRGGKVGGRGGSGFAGGLRDGETEGEGEDHEDDLSHLRMSSLERDQINRYFTVRERNSHLVQTNSKAFNRRGRKEEPRRSQRRAFVGKKLIAHKTDG